MYSDEKRPDGETVYEIIPVLEAAEPQRPKRPLWRRVLRSIIAFTALVMLFHAFVPMPNCSRKLSHRPDVLKESISRPALVAKPKLDYEWDPELTVFKMKQGYNNALPTLTKVFGKVLVGSCDKADRIKVHFDIAVSDDSLWNSIKIEPTEEGLYFAADVLKTVRQSVNITAYVVVPAAKDYHLSNFQVRTKELNIRLLDSFTTKSKVTYFESVSGNITSYGGAADVEQTKYATAKSVSGNIYGRFGLGEGLKLETVSGNIGVNITDANLPEVKAKLRTITVSGENRVQFAKSLHARPLRSFHGSASGKLIIDYPEEWQGKIKAKSVSGKIFASGPDVVVKRKENNAKGRFLKAIKGDGESYAELETVGGDISVAVNADAKHPDGDGIELA